MNIRQLALSIALGTAMLAGAYSAPASARGGITVVAKFPAHAPPPLRIERIGVARPGHVWIGGNWRWSAGRYAWTPGYWTRARVGYRHERGRWVACGRHWCFREGRWVR